MGAHGLDTFVYGPKNDPYHRERWREAYPDDAIDELRETVRVARRANVRFVMALSPGLDVGYASVDDFAALTAKLAQLARARIRHFALFFDDIGGLAKPADVARYGGADQDALARAHADLTNRTDRWLRRHGLPRLLFMVPSDYAGTECRPYHRTLGRALRPHVPIGWTGSGVFAETITGAEARAFRRCLGDHPVVLWDNFPVNDAILSSNLHLGPLTGRDGDLARALRGHLVNPMTQAHASLIGIGTTAAYLDAPDAYDPEAAWRAALAELDPSGGLAILAEQTRSSPLDLTDAHALAAAVAAVAATYATPAWQDAMTALEAEIARQAAAPATIERSLGGTPLGEEIAPWVAELAAHAAAEADAVRLLRAMKPDLADVTATLREGALLVRGRAVGPDDAVVAELGRGLAVVPPIPTLHDLIEGKGHVLSADVALRPDLGLNVHGKALYAVPYSMRELRTITGRNVHLQLLELVAARLADHRARERAGAMTVTIGDAPVALAADGTFDATVPLAAGGSTMLVVTTASGDATGRLVP
jgi:hyaluronoglucosaminidase